MKLALLAVAAAALPPPSAHDVARTLTGSAAGRITRADCVEASRGKYMCSYGVVKKAGRVECHIVQASWTPQRDSSLTVTLSGRTSRCRNLRDALRSLG